MEPVVEQIKYILSPGSIAIVGASSDFTKFAGRTLKYLLKHGYKGKIYPINPKYDEIVGLKCFPSIEAAHNATNYAGIDPSSLGTLYLATTSGPLRGKTPIEHPRAALVGNREVRTADFMGSTKAGSSALLACFDRIVAEGKGVGLGVASDIPHRVHRQRD